MLLYYITDRSQFSGTERERRDRLLERIAEAARSGADFIQLREKDLSGRELQSLSQAAVETIRSSGAATRLLINSRTDVALAAGAEGVHLRSNDISPQEVRKIWRSAKTDGDPLIAVSCHNEQEIIAAQTSGANFVVFGPVFEKLALEKNTAPQNRPAGLEQLRSVCRLGISVLALGGVSIENAASCIQAGAAGIAGIRLFQRGDLANTVKLLRESSDMR